MVAPVLVLLLSSQIRNVTRTPVAFVCSCEDILSKRYASSVRDAFSSSKRYMQVSPNAKAADGKSDAYEWKISMSSIPNDVESTGIAVSVAITYDGFYEGNFVQVCGSKTLNACASNLMAEFDSVVSNAK
jgi:hypothetical protein